MNINNINNVLLAGRGSLVGNIKKFDKQQAAFKVTDEGLEGIVKQGKKTVSAKQYLLSENIADNYLKSAIKNVKNNVQDGLDFMKEFMKAILS